MVHSHSVYEVGGTAANWQSHSGFHAYCRLLTGLELPCDLVVLRDPAPLRDTRYRCTAFVYSEGMPHGTVMVMRPLSMKIHCDM